MMRWLFVVWTTAFLFQPILAAPSEIQVSLVRKAGQIFNLRVTLETFRTDSERAPIKTRSMTEVLLRVHRADAKEILYHWDQQETIAEIGILPGSGAKERQRLQAFSRPFVIRHDRATHSFSLVEGPSLAEMNPAAKKYFETHLKRRPESRSPDGLEQDHPFLAPGNALLDIFSAMHMVPEGEYEINEIFEFDSEVMHNLSRRKIPVKNRVSLSRFDQATNVITFAHEAIHDAEAVRQATLESLRNLSQKPIADSEIPILEVRETSRVTMRADTSDILRFEHERTAVHRKGKYRKRYIIEPVEFFQKK